MRSGSAVLQHPGLRIHATGGMHATIRALPCLRSTRMFAKKGSKPGAEGPLGGPSSGVPPPPPIATPTSGPASARPPPPPTPSPTLGSTPTPNQPAQDWVAQQARSQAASARAERERRQAAEDAADAGRQAGARVRGAAEEVGDAASRAADDAAGAAGGLAAGLADVASEVAGGVAEAAESVSDQLGQAAAEADRAAASPPSSWSAEASVPGARVSPGPTPVRVGSPPPPPPPPASRVIPVSGPSARPASPGINGGASPTSPPSPQPDEKLVGELRDRLLALLPSLDRGVAAGPEVAARVESLAAQLGAAGGPVILSRAGGYGSAGGYGASPSDSTLQQLGGRWRLVYSSAFAKAGRLTLPLPLPANVGQIYQDIFTDTNELDNVLELLSPISLASVVPGLSGSRPTATVRLRHSFVLEGPSTLKISQTSTEIRPSGGLQGWLDSVPTLKPPSLPRGSGGSASFEILYLKDDLRISRSRGGIRVFLRGQA
ncbi:PLAP9 [Auxenochlorella protothecoides x Auxenochlorella symbiontica]